MKRIIEISAGEGGQDAQLLVGDMAGVYAKMCQIQNWQFTWLTKNAAPGDGFFSVKLLVEGKDLSSLAQEAGGHRFQRIPPTERKGRVHTSSIKVAVYDPNLEVDKKYFMTEDQHFKVEWFSGTGNGGQHRNKHQNSARVTHIPTGIIEARQGRSRENNLFDAKQALLARLQQAVDSARQQQLCSLRKEQMGSGERGDKIRTIRFQDNVVTNNINNTKMTTEQYMRGHIHKLWV